MPRPPQTDGGAEPPSGSGGRGQRTAGGQLSEGRDSAGPEHDRRDRLGGLIHEYAAAA